MEISREQWVNEVIRSAEEVQLRQAPDTLFDTINKTIDQPGFGERTFVSFNSFRLAMIAASLLIVFNISMLSLYLLYKKQEINNDNSPQSFASFQLDIY